jgi:zinc/manganese transport system ATP-binding protein
VSAIELTRVTLSRGGRAVLTDVSFEIGQSEFVGVFGPNGSGKTTLLLALLGLLPRAGGSIRIFGHPVTRGNPSVGYLPQQHSALSDLHLRGFDFVASAVNGQRWGLPSLGRAARVEVRRVIETVDAGALAERPLSELSGGELQRLLLAKALLGEPRLLLLDEPLTNLDPRYQQATVTLVQRIQREHGIAVLFTAHDLNSLVGVMDRVLYLGNGSVALGPVEEVVTSSVLSRIFGAPIEVFRAHGRILVVTAPWDGESEAHRHVM